MIWIERVRVMVMVGGESERGAWEMSGEREMSDVRVERHEGREVRDEW